MGKKVSLEEYCKVLEENDKLKELASSWIRRYEGRLQRQKDEADADLRVCEKARAELLELKKGKKTKRELCS